MELNEVIPTCEKNIKNMFSITLIPLINKPFLRPILLIADLILFTAIFSPLYYPNYYRYDYMIYSIDLGISFIVYNYLSYKYTNWEITNCFEHTAVNHLNERISLAFYFIFMIYWLYEAIIQFIENSEQVALNQFGNIFMSSAWYLYFSISSLLYYFICIKLAQRTQSINIWLKSLKHNRPALEEFYKTYKIQHRFIKVFSQHWNFIIFIGFINLTYHIPIDLVNIIYNNRYTDVVGVSIKSFALGWYLYLICMLNDMDTKVISYLYKHQLYTIEEMASIEKYAIYNVLGLDFYGIKINGTLIIKGGLITINLIIPTLYALVSNKFIKHST
jgi:hypothetical protein